MAYEYWTMTGSLYRRSEDPQGDIDAGLPVAMIGALRRRASPSALAFVAEPGHLTGQTDWRPLAEAVVAARGVGSEQVVPLADFFATSRGAFVAPASAESAAEALRDRRWHRKWRGRLWCTRVGRLLSAEQALRPEQDFDSPAGLTLDHVVTVASVTHCLDEEEAAGDLDAIRAVHRAARVQLHGLHVAGGTEIRHERTLTMREIFRLREHAGEWLGLLDVDDECLAYLLGERLHGSSCEPPPEEECERLMLARLHELEGEYRAAAARPARGGGGRRLTHTVLDPMPARLTLAGVEGKHVRRFLRAVQDGRLEEAGVRALLGLADCSDEMATGVLADLESLGVIVIDAPDPDPDRASLSVGPAGRTLAGGASATYTRATALDAIDRFIEAALAMNEDASSLYVVRSAAVFGSVLRGTPTVGDVDVAIELVPRDPESFGAEWRRRQTEALEKRNCEWWQIPPDYVRREAERVLAANSPVLSFCPLRELRPRVLAGGSLTVIDDFRPIPGAVDDLRRMDGAGSSPGRDVARQTA